MKKKLLSQLFLTDEQLRVMADIFIAAGQLAAGSAVLPFIIPNIDESRIKMVILGGLLTVACWMTSIFIVRKIK